MDSNSSINILLVEKDRQVINDITKKLTSSGYNILEPISTGRKTLAVVKKVSPDVVIIDYALDISIDGSKVSEQINEEFDIPIILLVTSTNSGNNNSKELRNGIDQINLTISDRELKLLIELAFTKKLLRNKNKKEKRFRNTHVGKIENVDPSIHKNSKMSLNEFELPYKVLFDSANDAIFLMEGDKFIDCNAKTLSIFNCTRDQIVKKKPTDFSPPYQPDGRISILKAKEKIDAALQGEPQFFNWTHKKYDGMLFDAEVSLNRVEICGKFYLQAIVRDVSEGKRSQEALRKERDLVSNIMETVPSGITVVNREGKIIFANPYAQQKLRLRKCVHDDQVYDVSHLRFTYFNGKPFPNRELPFAQVKRTNQPVNNIKYAVEFSDSKRVLLSTNAVPIFDVNGMFDGIVAAIEDITEKIEAGLAYEDSERRFRLLAENSIDIISQHSPSGEYRYVSPSCFKILGYKAEELVGKSSYEIIHPEDIEIVKESRSLMLEGTESVSCVYRVRKKDGTLIWFESVGRAVRDPRTESVTEIQITSRDITERKLVEEVLRRNEQRYRLLYNSINDAVFVHGFSENGLPGKFVEVNDVACRRLGYTREELLQMSPFDIDAPETKSLVPAMMVQLRKNKYAVWEGVHISKDGQRIPVEINNHLLEYEGQATILATVRDISERRQVEQQNVLLAQTIKTTKDCICITDLENNIMFLNDAFLETYGFSYSELRGKNISAILPNDDLSKQTQEVYNTTLEIGWHGERINRRKDGTNFPVELWTSVIKDINATPIGMVGIARDISERKKSEKALLESEGKFRALIQNSDNGIALINPDGKIVYESPAIYAITGYLPSERLEKNLHELIHHDDMTFVNDMFNTLKDGSSKNISTNLKVKHKDGQWRWIEITGTNMLDVQGVNAIVANYRDITERKEREDNIRILAHTVSSASECISITDMEGKIIYVNNAFLRTYGYNNSEIICKNISIIQSRNNDPDVVRSIAPATLEGGWYGEIMNIRKDGSEFPASLSTSIIYDESGRMIALVGIARDITERKQFERELYHSRQMLRFILDNIPQRVFWKDKNFKYMGCNKLFAKDAGLFDPNEIVGKTDFDLSWKSTAPIYRADDEWVMKQDAAKINYIEPQQRTDGSTFWIRTNKLPLHNSDGEVMGVLGTYEDITEKKQAEEQLRKLSRAVEQSPACVIITDTNGTIEYVNPKFTEITGYTLEEVIGKNPKILKSNQTSPEEYKRLWETIKAKKEWRGELLNKKKDGSLYWEFATITSITDSSGEITHFLALKEDITERKQLEQQLHQAQRLESIGTLVSGISHDFNNILNNIVGFSGQLKKYSHDPARVLRYSETIEKSSIRGSELAVQLLSLARRSKHEKEPTDVKIIVEELFSLCGETFPKNIAIEKNIDDHISPIMGKRGELYQALLNICLNARDAMPNGGTLTINMFNRKMDQSVPYRFRLLLGENIHGFIELCISDTGVGIPQSIIDRIFDPFFTTKERAQGTGLGLSVVYNIIRNHKGAILVDSKENIGSKFTILLPTVDGEIHHSSHQRDTQIKQGNNSMILLVDDEVNMRELGSELLEEVGYRVQTAKDGVEAVEIFREHSRDIALVILDLVMPRMDGGQAYLEMKKINPKVKAFFCTGYTSDEVISSLLKDENLRALQKPLRPRDFLQTVKEVLQES